MFFCCLQRHFFSWTAAFGAWEPHPRQVLLIVNRYSQLAVNNALLRTLPVSSFAWLDKMLSAFLDESLT
jgi:hypothetical protein